MADVKFVNNITHPTRSTRDMYIFLTDIDTICERIELDNERSAALLRNDLRSKVSKRV